MAKQRHVIKRQILELTVGKAADAHQLQADISRLYRQRIIPLLDPCCTELSNPDQIHRIESLEIDLGILDPERLEEEFVAKLEAALPQALATQISRQEQKAESHDPDLKTRSQLELLAFFARTGSLPWWTEAHRPRLLEECLEHLLRAAPEALRRSMAELAGEPAALRRLIHHYSDELLARLVVVSVPALKFSPSGTVQPIIGMVQESEVAANKRPAHLRLLAWFNLLQVAGRAGSQFRLGGQFYQAVLVRLAADLDTTYEALLAGLVRVGQQAKHAPLARLTEMFGSLSRQMSTLETTDTQTFSRLEMTLRAAAQRLPPPKQGEVLTLLSRLKAGEPGEVVQRLFAILGEHLSTEEIKQLTRLSAGEARLVAPLMAAEPALDSSFSEAETLYIGNAGLVILWPFLSHFFAHVDLLKKKQFKNPAARQRAVGLLQHLASGERSFPEYLLPLNKILCGMALGEVFDFGPPLSDAEAEEFAALLAAVIGQAPILRDMSVSGLRSTFLLRPGVLSSRDGAWLLQVERETYDIVLDRFPWGWEWVKLPWMEAPLRVEW